VKFLIDAQLPPGLADWISELGYEAEHVSAFFGTGISDEAIWRAAIAGGFIVISKDRDFAEWALARQPAVQVVWVRVGNATNSTLIARVAPHWSDLIEALEAGGKVVEAGRR
jgi:predicted nuclease of predicted toxin-antitoxin system